MVLLIIDGLSIGLDVARLMWIFPLCPVGAADSSAYV